MEKYELYFKDIFLGNLMINEGKYYFKPNQSGVNQAKEETVLIVEILKGTHGFIDPIPFFKSRIDTMNKLRVKEIRYHTDYFVLKKSYEMK